MKTLTLMFLSLWCCSPIYADPDTMIVSPDYIGKLNVIVSGDTISDGTRPHPNRVYLLQRGQRYLLDSRLQTTGYHLRLVGEGAPTTGTDLGPAVLQVAPRQDGGTDPLLLSIRGDLTLKNLWVLSWTTNDIPQTSNIQIVSDSTRIEIDRCVFEWAQGAAVTVKGIHLAMVSLTNNIFRNCADPASWNGGKAVEFQSAPVDSLLMENNTFENVAGVMSTGGYGVKWFWCNHNTFLNIARYAFLEEFWRDAYVVNNIFVNSNFAGERSVDRRANNNDSLLFGATINIDWLSSAYNLSDNPNEGDRKILFDMNSNYREPYFQEYYEAYNGAHPADPILAEPILNTRTHSFLTSRDGWMLMRNIYDFTNPRFQAAPLNRDSIVAFLTSQHMASGVSVNWGWDLDTSSPGFDPRGITAWPLPENLAYANDTLLHAGLNGLPLGDLNWFPDKLAQWVSLKMSERIFLTSLVGYSATGLGSETARGRANRYALGANYPNPFNPATTIRYSVPSSGHVELSVFNMLGQKIRTLTNGDVEPGSHTVVWDGRDDRGMAMASGVYFYQLQGGSGFITTRKMMLVK